MFKPNTCDGKQFDRWILYWRWEYVSLNRNAYAIQQRHRFINAHDNNCSYEQSSSGIILGVGSANERRRYNVTLSLIGWTHAQNDPWGIILGVGSANERRRYNATSSLIGWTHAQNDPCSILQFWIHTLSHGVSLSYSNLLLSVDTDGCFPRVGWNNADLAEIVVKYVWQIPTAIKQTYLVGLPLLSFPWTWQATNYFSKDVVGNV